MDDIVNRTLLFNGQHELPIFKNGSAVFISAGFTIVILAVEISFMFHFVAYSQWTLLLFFIACCLWILMPLWRWRCLLFFWCLPLFFIKIPTPKHGAAWLTVLDVGQGLATVIRTQHHVLIYDAGKPIAVPFLLRDRIHAVDMMMISHHDMDHRAGVPMILQSLKVHHILTSAPALFPSQITRRCYSGQHWEWDGVRFRILSPGHDQPPQDNNSSCVLRIKTKNSVILLPGDIEAPEEDWLLKHQRKYLAAKIIVAPHHGSRTSSSWPFLEAVQPKDVIFSTGYYNRYHFPAKEVVVRYRQLGARCYNTATNGAIELHVQ